MANTRIPGPIQAYETSLPLVGPLGLHDDGTAGEDRGMRGPSGLRGHRPIRVADAPKQSPKQKDKKPAETSTRIVHLHLYISIASGFSISDYQDWLRGPDDYEHPLSRWDEESVTLVLHTDKDKALDDLRKSLAQAGAVVVYMGHSVLGDKGAIGLTPKGGSKVQISPSDLTGLLNKAKCKLAIVAACDSQSCVGTLTGSAAVVVTDSGKDLKTWSTHWANALGAFLFTLIGYELDKNRQPQVRKGGHGTIAEALAASAKTFDDVGTKDRFKLVHGDGATTVFP